MTFQSFDEVRIQRELDDQLGQSVDVVEAKNLESTHSILVTALTCPSSDRIRALVSRSHTAAVPFDRPTPRYRPDGSKRAKVAEAKSEAWTAVG